MERGKGDDQMGEGGSRPGFAVMSPFRESPSALQASTVGLDPTSITSRRSSAGACLLCISKTQKFHVFRFPLVSGFPETKKQRNWADSFYVPIIICHILSIYYPYVSVVFVGFFKCTRRQFPEKGTWVAGGPCFPVLACFFRFPGVRNWRKLISFFTNVVFRQVS